MRTFAIYGNWILGERLPPYLVVVLVVPTLLLLVLLLHEQGLVNSVREDPLRDAVAENIAAG